VEALNAIHSLETELNAIKTEKNLVDDDFPRFFAEEIAYLEGLKQVPVAETLKINYVQSLQQLSQIR
jgi:hypothetical protein